MYRYFCDKGSSIDHAAGAATLVGHHEVSEEVKRFDWVTFPDYRKNSARNSLQKQPHAESWIQPQMPPINADSA